MVDLRLAGPVRVTRGLAPAPIVLLLSLLVGSCGSSTPGTTPTSPPAPAVSLAGTVTDATSGAPLGGATVAVQGKNATTGADGKYSITGLTAGSASATVQHQGHVNFSQNVTLSGATALDVKMTPSLAAAASGNWSGTWRNTTFGSTGTLTAVVSADTVAQTVRVTLDVNGNVFGAGDPPPETFTASYTGSGGTITQSSTRFGSVSITFRPDGSFTGTCTNIPLSGIARFDFTGSFTSTSRVSLTYTVTFTNGAVAVGTATLTK